MKKENLIQGLTQASKAPEVTANYKQDLESALRILNSYTFENRLQQKGLLSHTLVDSLSLFDALGEKIIAFDQSLK